MQSINLSWFQIHRWTHESYPRLGMLSIEKESWQGWGLNEIQKTVQPSVCSRNSTDTIRKITINEQMLYSLSSLIIMQRAKIMLWRAETMRSKQPNVNSCFPYFSVWNLFSQLRLNSNKTLTISVLWGPKPCLTQLPVHHYSASCSPQLSFLFTTTQFPVHHYSASYSPQLSCSSILRQPSVRTQTVNSASM